MTSGSARTAEPTDYCLLTTVYSRSAPIHVHRHAPARLVGERLGPRPHGRARDGGRQADGLGVLEVGVDGGDDDARLDRDQVDADERDADPRVDEDRKSTRLNSSHANISYAVFCLKKKKPSLPPGS